MLFCVQTVKKTYNSQTQDFPLFELSNVKRRYFCWRMPTSIYIVSYQKLITGACGSDVVDNMTI